MQNNETRGWLYNNMKSLGYDLGSYEEFDAHADEEETRKWLYDNGSRSGLNLGSYEEFDVGLGKKSNNSEGSVARQVAAESGNNYNPEAGKGSDPTLNNTGRISPPSSPYVTGKGADVRVFDVPYNDYIAMSPQQQSEVYQKAIDKKKVEENELISQSLSSQKESVNADLRNVYNEIRADEEQYRKEHPLLSFLQGFGQAQTGGRNQRTVEADPRYRNLQAASNLIDESENLLNEAKANKDSAIRNFGRGFRDMVFDVDTWTAGFSDLNNSLSLSTVLDKAEKGEELSPDEQRLLDASVINLAVNAFTSSDISTGYNVGKTSAYSIPFMLEFAVNPISRSGNTIARNLLEYGLKRFGRSSAQTAKKGALNALGRGITSDAGKFAGRFIGDTAAAAGMTATTSLPRVMSGAVERMNDNYTYDVDENGELAVKRDGNVGIGEAVGKSAASTLLENQSEMVFNAFKGMGKSLFGGINKSLPGGVQEFFNRISSSKPGQLYRELKNNPTMREIARRTQFHGLPEEYLEEVYNNFANIPLGEMSWEEATDLDNNIQTFLSLAPTSVMFGMLGLGSMASERYSNRRKLNRAFGRMNEEQKAGLKELLRKSKENGNAEIREFIKATIADESMTPEQKREQIEHAFEIAKGNAIDDIQEAETEDSIEKETEEISSLSDPSTGTYTEANRIVVNDVGEEVFVPGYIVGNIGGRPVWVAEGMENVPENRITLKPGELDESSVRSMPTQEVMSSVADMRRAQAKEQAENESKYSPDIKPPFINEMFSDGTNTYQIVRQEPDGSWLANVLNESGTPIRTIPMTDDEYYRIRQSQIDAEEQRTEGAVSGNKLLSDGRMAVQTGTDGNEVAYDVTDRNGNVVDSGSMQAAEFSSLQDYIPESNNMSEKGADNETRPEDGESKVSENPTEEAYAIPSDEKGNLLYHKVPVNVTVEALNKEELEPEEVDSFVKANKDASAKLLSGLQNKPPKMGTNIAKYKADKQAWQEKVADAQSQVDYWNLIDESIAASRVQPGDKTAKEIREMGEPLDGHELAARSLANGRLPLLYDDYKRELGFSDKEASKMFGLFKNRDNGGLTIEQAGELLMQNDLEEGTNFFDQNDANAGRNAILDVLSSARTRNDLSGYIKKNREAMAERERTAEREYEDKQREDWAQENFGMSYSDYVTFNEVIDDIIREKAIPEEEIGKFYNTFAEELNNWNNGRVKEETEGNDRGTDSEGGESGEGVLPDEQLGDTGGVEADTPAETDVNADNEGVPAPEENIEARIEEARKEVAPNPTDAQKEAGNYKKGHVKIDGYDITIENPKGSERSGIDANGDKWSVTMNNDYGYIRGTEGVDGDHIDVFLSDNPAEGNVYVVDQLDTTTGKFDEHKVMYGFGSIQEATDAYLANYSPGWMGISAVTEVSKDEFKKWIDSSHRKTKPFVQYKSVNAEDDTRFRIVHHGTGTSFDKFSTEKIGTGEGNQSFGWGLYFTDKKDIAQYYAETIGDMPSYVLYKDGKPADMNDEISRVIYNYDGDVKKAIRSIKRNANMWKKEGDEEFAAEIMKTADRLKLEDPNSWEMKEEGNRHIYDVEIPDTGFLHWDNPMTNEQKRLIIEQAGKEGIKISFYGDLLPAVEFFDKMGSKAEGEQIYKALERTLGSDKEASLFLNRAGFNGIEYVAGRHSGKKSVDSNFVIFDENAVRIINHLRYRKQEAEQEPSELAKVNERFNEQLQKQIDGTLPKGHIYKLGTPSDVLLSTGVPNLPIQLNSTRLIDKATKYGHNYNLEEIKDLVTALQSPIAVFAYGDKTKGQNIIVELSSNGKNFVVGMSLNPIIGGKALEINSIRNVFPKGNAEWLNWITQAKLLYVDKERIQNLIDQQRTILADVDYLDLDSVTKIVESFENPTVEQGKITRTIEDLSSSLHTPVKIARTLDDVSDTAAKRAIEQGRSVKAWFDPNTGEVVVYLPNATDVNDAVKSVLHEVVGHKGLREMLVSKEVKGAEERRMAFDNAMMELYRQLPIEVRNEIADIAVRSYGGDVSIAMDEYLAEQAEKNEIPSWWNKVVATIRDLLRKFGIDVKLSENDVRYLLWESQRKLRNSGNPIDVARETVMRDKLGIGEHSKRAYHGGESDFTNPSLSRFSSPARKEGESVLDYADRVDKAYREFLENQEALRLREVDKEDGDVPLTSPTVQAWDKLANSTKFLLRETAVDYLTAVEKFQDLISKTSGKEIKSYEDAYQSMLALSSKNKDEMDRFDSFFVKPMNRAILKLTGKKKGLKKWNWDQGPLRELVMYVEAKHGIERNRQMAVENFASEDKEKMNSLLDMWNLEKERINKQEISWKEKQFQLDEAAALIGADLKKDYSGLSSIFKDKEAYPEGWKEASENFVNQYEETHEKKDIDELWKTISNATGYALNKQYQSGLVSKEYVERQLGRFENYIPLRGFKDEIAGDVYNYIENEYYKAGNPVKSAGGRSSEAGNPFGSILNIAYSSISSGNKNIAKQDLFNLILNHGTDGLAVIDRSWRVTYDALKDYSGLIVIPENKTGENVEWVEAVPYIPEGASPEEVAGILNRFEEAMESLKKDGKAETINKKGSTAYKTLYKERNEHQIPLFVGGDKYVITITGNPRLAQAMNGLLNPEINEGALSEIGNKVQRFMAGAFTSNNIAFAVANLSKDTIYSNNQMFIRESPGYWWKFTKNQKAGFLEYPQMMVRLKKYQNGTLDVKNDTDQLFKEFMEHGGATGYTFVDTQKEYAKKLADDLNGLAKKMPQKLSAKGLFHTVFDSIEFAGQSAELVNRFAAYKTSREMGRSVKRSITDAKEVTVNFNRKGAGIKTAKGGNVPAGIALMAGFSQYGRASILFWNANMQAKYRFYKNLKEHPVKTGTTLIANSIALGAVTIPFLNNIVLPALYSVFGWDDDSDKEDYYDVLTDYERTNNICIRLPKGKGWLKIPLSPELAPWYSMGDLIGGKVNGKLDVTTADFSKNFVDAVFPLGINWEYEGPKSLLNFMPTITQPLIQNAMNVNFMGNPIAKEPISEKQKYNPKFKQVYRNTSPLLIELSKTINSIGGGDDVKASGAFTDWNPAYVQNLINGYTGGYGSVILSLADWIVDSSKNESASTTASRMPLVSRFFVSGNEEVKQRRINSSFHKVGDFVNEFEHDLKEYTKAIKESEKDKDLLRKAEYVEKLEKLINSPDSKKYQILKEVNKSVKEYDKYLKEFPDDEETQAIVYRIKMEGIEMLRK